MKRVIVLSFALCSLMAAGFEQATTQPATQPSDGIDEAVELYRSGNLPGAIREASARIVELRKSKVPQDDPRIVDLLHLQLVCNLKLGRHTESIALANQLFPFAATDRAMMLNVAICDIRARSYVVRMARMLRDHAQAKPTDEDVMNMWGAALMVLAKQAKPVELDEQTRAYLALDTRLEATRPGFKRWGSTWMTAAEFEKIKSEKDQANREVASAESVAKSARMVVEAAQRECDEHASALMHCSREEAKWRRAALRDAERRLKTAKLRLSEAERAVDQAKDRIPKPTWIAPAGPFLPLFLQ